MEIALFNHHTPYVAMLAKALPEHVFHTLPTRHAPEGWRRDQRPFPENVEPWPGGYDFAPDKDYWQAIREHSGPPPPDVVLLQSGWDLPAVPADEGGGLPWVFLSHNHARLESGCDPARGLYYLAGWLAAHEVPLVCISAMKAASWVDAGYPRAPIVIPPGFDLTEYVASGDRHEGDYVLTVCNGLDRPLFDRQGWEALTKDVPVHLVGEGNEGIRGAVGPAASWEALKEEYRQCAVYLNPTCPPFEDAYNLSSLEAMAWGAGVQNLHGAVPSLSEFPVAAFRERWLKVLKDVSDG